MEKRFFVTLLFTIVLFFFSCDTNAINGRLKHRSPFDDVVELSAHEAINAVSLSWREDLAADTYLLMRSIYTGSGDFDFLPVYKGVDLMYTDKDIEMSLTYVYRLDKQRGAKVFEGKKYSYYSRPLPFPGAIAAQSINGGLSVYLTWAIDANADKYIVLRTASGIGGVDFSDEYVTEKYEFTNTYSYIDNTIDVEQSYAYRLDKVRGGHIFEGTEITFFEKSRSDPFPGVITAQSLNNGKAAYLTWEADFGADEYRVMRAINDGSPLVFKELEDMKDNFYLQGPYSALDTGLLDDTGYLYRLDKRRGVNWLIGIDITLFSRTRPMPLSSSPFVESFRADGNILIRWDYDEGADAYILRRKFDSVASSDFEVVYEGLELEYLDKNMNAENLDRFVYVLSKARNGVSGWSGVEALGVACRTQPDNHEPNDTEAQATLLETFRVANIYCFGFSAPYTFLEDIDWFKVNVPPGKSANIAVQYPNESYCSYFLLYIPYKETRPIVHDVAFKVLNDDVVQREVAFAIIPNRSKFLTDPSGKGGMVLSYTIIWQSID